MPESNVWKLDPTVPDTWAAIFDPFGNAVHTVSEAYVSLKSVLITGAGSIGLMAVAVAAAAGASKIIAIDPNPHKRALAKQLGAQAAFDPADPGMRRAILELVGDAGPDVFLEMSGSGAALESGLSLLRHGGRAAILGISAGKVTLDVSELIVLKGITVLGIFGRKIWETWYQMQQLVKDRRVDLAPIISHVVPFERFEECFTTLKQRDAVKIVLDIAGPAS
jgi:threonine 3-dehydrogenase